MSRERPGYYNDLDATCSEIWSLWARGANDRHCAFHSPTLVTQAGEWPAARTLILRAVDREARSLLFHTDVRAGKVEQLEENSRAVVHVWDDRRSIQVRARALVGRADTQTTSREWSNLSGRSQALYGIEPAPAQSTDAPVDMPSEASSDGRANFVVLDARVVELEWLFLFHEGHRRARFRWHSDEWLGEWLVP